MRWQRRIASTGVAVLTLSVAPAHAAAGSAPCGPSVSTPVPQPTAAHLAAAGLAGFPLARDDRRVDLVAPPFTNSTDVTNPLFPISELRSAILNGHDHRLTELEANVADGELRAAARAITALLNAATHARQA